MIKQFLLICFILWSQKPPALLDAIWVELNYSATEACLKKGTWCPSKIYGFDLEKMQVWGKCKKVKRWKPI
jgi:hypothetical protein